MEVKDAFRRMRREPLKFWCCEKGRDGKPVLLLSLKRIPPAEIAKAKEGAQAKVFSRGEMTIDDEGVCHVVPTKEAPHSLAKAVQIVARNNSVMPKAMVIDAPVPDEEEDAANGGAALLTQALQPGYEGEDKELGWRAKNYPDAIREKHGLTPERTDIRVTTYVTDDEARRDLVITADEEGRAQALPAPGSQVSPVVGTKADFVIDPKNRDVLRTPAEDNRALDRKAGQRGVSVHHSTPLAGGAVAGAGSMTFDAGGHVTEVNDQSGHYKPSIGLTQQAVGIMDRKGLLTNRAFIGPDGESFEAALKALGPEGAQLDQEYAELNRGLDDPDLAPKARGTLLAKRKTVLFKLAKQGIAPGNSEAMVRVLGKGSMIGEDEYETLKAIADPYEKIAAVQATVRRKAVGSVVGSQEYAALQQQVTASATEEMRATEAEGGELSAADKQAIRGKHYKAAVEPHGAASVADLKAALGEAVLANESDATVAKRARKLGIADVNAQDVHDNVGGYATLNFTIGKHTALAMKKSQFLAAGADEGQIDLKRRVRQKIEQRAFTQNRTQSAAAQEMERERGKERARQDVLDGLGRSRYRALAQTMQKLEGDPVRREGFEKALGCTFGDETFLEKLGLALVPQPNGSDEDLVKLAKKHGVKGAALDALDPAAVGDESAAMAEDEAAEIEAAPPIDDDEAEQAAAERDEADASDADAAAFFGGPAAPVPGPEYLTADDLVGEDEAANRSARPAQDYGSTDDLVPARPRPAQAYDGTDDADEEEDGDGRQGRPDLAYGSPDDPQPEDAKDELEKVPGG